MPLTPGTRLGPYEITAQIGVGGMGEVYRATDTKLKRDVALKLVSESSILGDEAQARFLREARVAATLNHPNICTIYEIGELPPGADVLAPAGAPYIAMEYIEGQTLARLLAREGRLSLKSLLSIAVQVAEGLAEAHRRQVVHRDLKPQNVMVSPEGRVKILDFGLAKLLGPTDPSDEVLTAAETQSAELTQQGKVLGTIAYMSPEQALGKPLDQRSDVFSFGTMLFQMAAGRSPFQGETGLSTIAKIIETDPPSLVEAVPGVPLDFDRVVRRCLQKDPDARYNDTRDLLLD